MPSLTERAGASRVLRMAAAALLLAGVAACAAPPPPPVYVEAPVPATPDRILMLTVPFDFDSYTIRPEAYGLLDNVAIALNDRRLAGYHFDINGHTDIIGRLGYNIALSQLRAGAVANYLSARGVPRESMRIQGFGPLNLLDPGNPASPVNRRVEIVSVR